MVHPDPQAPKEGSGGPAGPPGKSGKYGSDRDLWRYLGAGTQLAVTVGLFVWLGWWLDKKFGWEPWGLVTTSSVGVAVGMYAFLKDAL